MCAVCYGEPGCPVCVQLVDCPHCYGYGANYYDEYGMEVRIQDYVLLPQGMREKETCSHCEGSGKVEKEYSHAY